MKMKLRILLKKIAMRLKKEGSNAQHEKKPVHTNKLLFKGAEETK